MMLARTRKMAFLAAIGAFCFIAPMSQALPPITKTVEIDPTVKQTSVADMYQHGMQLIVTLQNDDKMIGTLVYANPSQDFLVMRTQPGTLPKKISGKDIKDIAKIKAASLSGPNGKGGIKPAGPEELPTPATNTGEISTVTVYNGSVPSIRYIAPALSPSESQMLTQLQEAENKIAELKETLALSQTYIQNAKRIDDARTNALVRYYNSPPVQYAVQSGITNSYSYGNPYYGYVPGYYGSYAYGGYGAGSGTYNTVPYIVPNPTSGEGQDSIIKAATAQVISKNITPEAISNAEKSLAQARGNAIFGADGNLIAMRVEPEIVTVSNQTPANNGNAIPNAGTTTPNAGTNTPPATIPDTPK